MKVIRLFVAGAIVLAAFMSIVRPAFAQPTGDTQHPGYHALTSQLLVASSRS